MTRQDIYARPVPYWARPAEPYDIPLFMHNISPLLCTIKSARNTPDARKQASPRSPLWERARSYKTV